MANGDREPFVKFGGDPKPALDAIRKVSDGFKRFEKAGKQAAKGISAAFKGLANVMRGLARFMTSAFARAWRLTKIGIVGVVGAITAATIAWNKEAAAQARINTILRNNIKNWRGARKELDAMIRTTQKLTNFSDRDVELIFMNLIGQLGSRGFAAGRQLREPILDVAATLGIPVQTAAEAVARNIGAGTVGETFRRFGVRTPVEQFRRMSIDQRVGATAREIGAFAGGAARRDRQENPFRGMMNNLGNVLEIFGRPFAGPVNKALEKMAQSAQAFADAFNPKDIKDIWLFFKAQMIATLAGIKAAIAHLFGGAGLFKTAGAGGMFHTTGFIQDLKDSAGPMLNPFHSKNKARRQAGKLRRNNTVQKIRIGAQRKVGFGTDLWNAFWDSLLADLKSGLGLFPAVDQGVTTLKDKARNILPQPGEESVVDVFKRTHDETLRGIPGYAGLFGGRKRRRRGGSGRPLLNNDVEMGLALLANTYESQGYVGSEAFEAVDNLYPGLFERDTTRRAIRRAYPRGPGLAAIDSFGLHNKRGAAVMAVQ